MKRIAGYILLAIPFVAWLVASVVLGGWRFWGPTFVVLGVVACIVFGVLLTERSTEEGPTE